MLGFAVSPGFDSIDRTSRPFRKVQALSCGLAICAGQEPERIAPQCGA